MTYAVKVVKSKNLIKIQEPEIELTGEQLVDNFYRRINDLYEICIYYDNHPEEKMPRWVEDKIINMGEVIKVLKSKEVS